VASTGSARGTLCPLWCPLLPVQASSFVTRSPSTGSRLATRNAHEERSVRCSHRRLTTGSTGAAAARALGGLGITQWQIGARLRSARDSTGAKRTGALGAQGVSGGQWRQTGPHPDPERGWQHAPARWSAAVRALPGTLEAVSSPAGAVVHPLSAGECV
jgi:hypothetical protein